MPFQAVNLGAFISKKGVGILTESFNFRFERLTAKTIEKNTASRVNPEGRA